MRSLHACRHSNMRRTIEGNKTSKCLVTSTLPDLRSLWRMGGFCPWMKAIPAHTPDRMRSVRVMLSWSGVFCIDN
jgi:hypothetical protein